MGLYDIEGSEYVVKLAEKLQETGEFEMPPWANYVKTSIANERPPFSSNWWGIRAASILRQIYIRGVVGVGRLSTKYGGKMDRGMRPPKFFKGSRKIIRVILQQAEKAGYLEKVDKKAEGRKGRRLTKKGRQFLDSIAN